MKYSKGTPWPRLMVRGRYKRLYFRIGRQLEEAYGRQIEASFFDDQPDPLVAYLENV